MAVRGFSKDSLDIAEERIKRLKELFPEVFCEGKIDFDKLRAVLGEKVFKRDEERYVLDWAQKSDVFKNIQTSTTKTLQALKEESVNFDSTQNIFIEGENLEVLKVLQKSYFGKIKMIYIDPPYNTGNDKFIYPDKFSESKEDYLKKINEKDEEGYLLKEESFRKNSKENGRFHSNWLNMIYPRLFLARNLLREDGVIFISIDDNEQANLKILCDEIFGEENFVSCVIWQKKTGASDAITIATVTEYILIYAKNMSLSTFSKNNKSYDVERYKHRDQFVKERGPYYIDNLDRGGLQYSGSLNYGIECPDRSIAFPNGRKEYKNDGWIWKWSKDKVEWAKKNGFIEFRKSNLKDSGWAVCYKNYLKVDNDNKPIRRAAPHKNLINNILNANAADSMKELFSTNNYFNYSKPVELIKHLLSFISCEEQDIILDFFAGSGTTAQAVMELNKEDGGNRKFILVQLPEKTDENSESFKSGFKTISDISKERVRRVIKRIGNEIIQKSALLGDKNNLDLGFKVYRLKESNFKIWRSDIIKDQETFESVIDAFEDPVREGAKEENMLVELLLKSGYDLNADIKIIETDGSKIYFVNGELVVCLDKMSQNIIDKIIGIKPAKCLMLDRLFNNDDSFKTNTVLQLQDEEIILTVI
uniref:site-specific DNA-methyltransferase (adenine-specific) n=1 Tax=Candidatus Endomicrobium sp. MdMp-027 TaxID=1837116 RepID=A0A1C9ZT86_9BACT|nr:type III DNA methylase [Candidatus Endomicrobium sp. MdMp-027]